MAKINIYETFEIDESSFCGIGFPKSEIISKFNRELNKTDMFRDNISYYTFNPEKIAERQEIIKRIYSKPRPWERTVLGEIKSLRSGIGDLKRNEEIIEISERAKQLYNLCNRYLETHQEFKDDQLYEDLRIRNERFNEKFQGLIQSLNEIENIKTFYVDEEGACIIPIKEKIQRPENMRIAIIEDSEIKNRVIRLRNELKIKAVEMHAAVIQNFQSRIITEYDHVLSRHRDYNVRTPLEMLILPQIVVNTYEFYKNNFRVKGYNTLNSLDSCFPEFKNYFDIVNMFPLTIKHPYRPNFSYGEDNWPNDDEFDMEDRESDFELEYVPINFKSKPGENKFLLAGLNSGGKSFFLENLVTAYLIGSMGLPLPAGKVVLPKYKNLTYYKNTERGNGGKLESEMTQVARIVKTAKKDDVIVIDDFFEGGTPQVTSYIAADFLNMLSDIKSTVFIESHAPLDLNKFEKKGWAVYSPEYIKENGKIKPTYRLIRKKPNPEIMVKYARQIEDKCLSADIYD